MFGILADGQWWEDSDGNTAWPAYEADALAEQVARRGYEVEVVPF